MVQRIHDTLTLSSEKHKISYFASSRMKRMVVFPSRTNFRVILIC